MIITNKRKNQARKLDSLCIIYVSTLWSVPDFVFLVKIRSCESLDLSEGVNPHPDSLCRTLTDFFVCKKKIMRPATYKAEDICIILTLDF